MDRTIYIANLNAIIPDIICPNKFRENRLKLLCSKLLESKIKVEKVVKDPKNPINKISRVILLNMLNVMDNSIISPNTKQPRILTIKIPQGKDKEVLGTRLVINSINEYLDRVPRAPAKANSVNVRMCGIMTDDIKIGQGIYG